MGERQRGGMGKKKKKGNGDFQGQSEVPKQLGETTNHTDTRKVQKNPKTQKQNKTIPPHKGQTPHKQNRKKRGGNGGGGGGPGGGGAKNLVGSIWKKAESLWSKSLLGGGGPIPQ